MLAAIYQGDCIDEGDDYIGEIKRNVITRWVKKVIQRMIQKQRSIFKTIWIIALIGLLLLLMRQLINAHEKLKVISVDIEMPKINN